MKDFCRGTVWVKNGVSHDMEFVFSDGIFYAWCSCDRCSRQKKVCSHIREKIAVEKDLTWAYEEAGKKIVVGRP